MSAVVLRQVKKQFGQSEVIRGIDLDIAEREFVVFVGPSGCGKSTLLRLISGLDACSSGAMSIGGRDVTHLEPSDRGIAMVFQSYALYPHMTVEENMGFGLRMAKVSAQETKQRIDVAAKSLQLDALLARYPRQLSGGQRQRVAIGRAIVRQPQVFLFDEPLSNLDAELRVHMRVEIAKLHQRLGATMIYVTHDQVEAMTLADKIVVLQQGRVEQVGSPLQLYDDPDNQFVAGFIGSPKMNFLAAQVSTIQPGRVGLRLKLTQEVIEVPLSGQSVSAGQELVVGVRPEHISTEDRTGAAGWRMPVEVTVTEQMGSIAYLHSALESGESMVIERKEGARGLKPGDRLHAFAPAERIFAFDQQGKRLR
jgi:lactose/L-arabinose transport system ATP-binding protein